MKIKFYLFVLYYVLLINTIGHMKKQGTKQLMQDLQAAIKELKSVHTERSKILENIKTDAINQTVESSNK